MIAKMPLRTLVLLFVVVWCGLAQPAIADTPAGHTLQAWLEAFNSGDQSKIEKYVNTIDPSQSVDGMIAFHNQTGGFELLSIESSDPTHIRFRVKEKGGSTTALGNLLVKDGHPPTVETFGLRALPPGAVPVNVTLDASFRKRVIDGVNAGLAEFYVDAAVAREMQEALLAHQKAGEYESITDGDAFAERLTKDLRAVSHDKHLGVNFSPFKMPQRQTPGPGDIAQMHQQMEHGQLRF